MSNYLANLAARSLNRTRPVLPRLRGRFEPAIGIGEGLLNEPLAHHRAVFEAFPIETEPATPNNRRPYSRQPAQNHRKSASPNEEISLDTPAVEANRQSPNPLEAAPGQPIPIRTSTEPTPPLSETRTARAQPERVRLRTNAEQSASVIANTERGKATSVVQHFEMADSSNAKRRPNSVQPERIGGSTRFRNEQSDANRVRPINVTIDEPELAPSPAHPKPNQRLVVRDQSQAVVREERAIADLPQPDPTLNSPSSTISQQRPRPADLSSNSDVSVVIAQPRITPLVEGRRSMSALDHIENVTPQPTVQVTIGRIEVRAVQSAPTASPRPRAAPPVMNLDDYLRQRSGGRAR